jgi:hypothetical protein
MIDVNAQPSAVPKSNDEPGTVTRDQCLDKQDPHIRGVPRGKVRYDNLKAAVSRVLGFTRYRQEADRWTAFRSHYDLEPFYCQPGIEGAHEKGGVEGDVGWFRRNHMVPVPSLNLTVAHCSA